MTNLQQLKEQTLQYLSLLQKEPREAVKAIFITLFAVYLTFKFMGSYSSTSGYDIRGEFCGYLMQFSFVAFLYLNIKFTGTESRFSHGLKSLAFIQLLLAITNFLIIKSLTTLFILKIFVLFSSILLFLAVIRGIANN